MLHLESFCEGIIMEENSIYLNIQSRETSTLTQIMYICRTHLNEYLNVYNKPNVRCTSPTNDESNIKVTLCPFISILCIFTFYCPSETTNMQRAEYFWHWKERTCWDLASSTLRNETRQHQHLLNQWDSERTRQHDCAVSSSREIIIQYTNNEGNSPSTSHFNKHLQHILLVFSSFKGIIRSDLNCMKIRAVQPIVFCKSDIQ